MNTTQQHLLISEIKDDILILKNGGGALVLQVSAVNFGLLSDREQIAIISSFAQMLNSLNFSIQIVIYSERLNINSYLNLLDKAKQAQLNPLMANMMASYKQFIQTTIKENDVLDKKFYIIIPLFSLELGVTASKTSLEQKIETVLLPRQDQIIRQLSRIGLRATQVTDQKLVELFFDIYNGQIVKKNSAHIDQPIKIELNLRQPQQTHTPPLQTTPTEASPAPQPPIQIGQSAKNHPFIVEELEN